MFSRLSLVLILSAAGCSGGDGYVPPDTDATSPTDLDGDGFTVSDGDCDDDDDAYYPGANDISGDEKDQDCDGIDGVDADHDGFASQASGGPDCNDADDVIFPGAEEIGWDDIDQDCDTADRHDFVEVSTGAAHTCALDSLGRIRCWGSDVHAQVSLAPGDAGWTHVSSGEAFSCAVHLDGRLTCWGDDEKHQIQDVPPGPGDVDGRIWDQVDCGHETACALDPEGKAVCWGLDEDDQVTDTPTVVELKSIAAGREHVCGVTEASGTVICWGAASQDQDQVPFGEQFQRITSGAAHSCVIRQDLGLKCWGDVAFGQTYSPSDAGPYSLLAASNNTTCGILEAQTLSCWGQDSQYQVRDAPTDTDVHYVDVWDHGCAIRNEDDGIVCWGKNLDGQATVPQF